MSGLLDNNTWYQITNACYTQSDFSLVASSLLAEKNSEVGSIFFGKSQVDANIGQQWQVFPWNSTYSILRSKAVGSGAYLQSFVTKDGDIGMRSRIWKLSVDSMFWKIATVGNGSFRLSNAGNGTDYAWAANTSTGYTFMDSNTTGKPLDHPCHQWSFTEIKKIDDIHYSTLQLPTSTATINSSTFTSPTNNAGESSSPDVGDSGTDNSGNGHSSRSIGIGIGVGIGAVILLALLVMGILAFFRRQKTTKEVQRLPQYSPPMEFVQPYQYHHPVPTPPLPSQISISNANELGDHTQIMELPGKPRPVEINDVYTPYGPPRGYQRIGGR